MPAGLRLPRPASTRSRAAVSFIQLDNSTAERAIRPEPKGIVQEATQKIMFEPKAVVAEAEEKVTYEPRFTVVEEVRYSDFMFVSSNDNKNEIHTWNWLIIQHVNYSKQIVIDLPRTEVISFLQTLKAQSENVLGYLGPCAFAKSLLS